MHIEEVKLDILREAGKHGNQICKLKNDCQEFVKVRRGYSQPDELRAIYLAALSDLLLNGLVKLVFSNRDLELFELTAEGSHCTTVRSARERIMDELKSVGRVYKIHSDRGEFVQFAELAINDIDAERILFMLALHELLHHGVVQVVSESREMASYELAPPDSGYVQYYAASNTGHAA
jgi:hypothetical protein